MLDYQPGVTALRKRLQQARREALTPPPTLTVSQWADEHAMLSAETSGEPGKFRAFAYQNGIMDAVNDPTIKTVSVMKSARVGYTKCLDNVVGYFLHQDPAPILMVQPRDTDAEDYSETEILPMIRDTEVLAEIAGNLNARGSGQKKNKRTFRNGSSITFVGANAPGGFRRITARIILFDEVDGYPATGAGDEGDQIRLGIKRGESFWNRKVVMGSTPTIKGISRIEKAWLRSDQRRFYVKCPHCQHPQVLKWSNLQWNKDVDEHGRTIRHYPETAYFLCESGLGCIIEESDKAALIDGGEWIAEKPFNGHAGFHIWSAYSLFPNAAWRLIVEEFLAVKDDPSQLKTFVMQTLGETWEEQGEQADGNSLMSRCEVYDEDTVPNGAMIAVAGVDTQGDRLEVQVVSFGRGEESWSVAYHVLYGDPAQRQVWQELDEILLRPIRTEDGRILRIRACCVDSGGNHTASVLAYCRTRLARKVFATKGAGGPRPIWPPRGSRTKTNDKVFIVGVDTAKEQLYARLRITKPGPGCIHFPAGGAYDAEYFAQLTAEKVMTRYRNGRPYRVWEPTRERNEALDTYVLAHAALKSLPVRLDAVKRPHREVSTEPTEENAPKEEVAQSAVEPAPEGDIRFRQRIEQKTKPTRERPMSRSSTFG